MDILFFLNSLTLERNIIIVIGRRGMIKKFFFPLKDVYHPTYFSNHKKDISILKYFNFMQNNFIILIKKRKKNSKRVGKV